MDGPLDIDFGETVDLGNPTEVWIYGPPRSIRGRVANRLRRLFRITERDEVYAVLPYDPNGGQQLSWDARGIFRLDDRE